MDLITAKPYITTRLSNELQPTLTYRLVVKRFQKVVNAVDQNIFVIINTTPEEAGGIVKHHHHTREH